MINRLDNKFIFLIIIGFQVLLGMLGNYFPTAIGYVYLGIFMLMSADVVYCRDKDSRAGFYALYLMGFEIVYRIAGTTFSHELGKYLAILILLVGVIAGRRKYTPFVFLFGLFLLLPALFLSDDPDPVRIRKMILFNLSGPLCIVFSGLYFYKRKIEITNYIRGLQFAFLPAFSAIVILSLKAGLSTLQFDSVSSNTEASGGFGANQVSSVIGWFVMLVLLVKIQGVKLTPFNWLDWGMLLILLIRGLLTMSRGGMMSAAIGLIFSSLFYFYVNSSFRKSLFRMFPYILAGLIVIGAGVLYANKISNNYLLYRYQGKTTNEVVTGIVSTDKSYLTGRDKIMEGDFAAFLEYPFLGVGYGMATSWHLAYFGSAAAAHTEFARLLSENGSLGLLFMLILFIILPLKYMVGTTNDISKYFMIAMFLVSMMTMFHGAMRLSLAGIAYGASFIILVESKKEE
jgi:hypothetical protein